MWHKDMNMLNGEKQNVTIKSWFMQRLGNNTLPRVISEGRTGIGRNLNCSIICKSSWVSRNHCQIVIKDGTIVIEDNGSFNGTFIGNVRIMEGRETQLKNGDVISFGLAYEPGQEVGNDHYAFRVIQGETLLQGDFGKRKASVEVSGVAKRQKENSPLRRRSLEYQPPPGYFLTVPQECTPTPRRASFDQYQITSTQNVVVPEIANGVPVECIDLTLDDAAEPPEAFPTEQSTPVEFQPAHITTLNKIFQHTLNMPDTSGNMTSYLMNLKDNFQKKLVINTSMLNKVLNENTVGGVISIPEAVEAYKSFVECLPEDSDAHIFAYYDVSVSDGNGIISKNNKNHCTFPIRLTPEPVIVASVIEKESVSSSTSINCDPIYEKRRNSNLLPRNISLPLLPSSFVNTSLPLPSKPSLPSPSGKTTSYKIKSLKPNSTDFQSHLKPSTRAVIEYTCKKFHQPNECLQKNTPIVKNIIQFQKECSLESPPDLSTSHLPFSSELPSVISVNNKTKPIEVYGADCSSMSPSVNNKTKPIELYGEGSSMSPSIFTQSTELDRITVEELSSLQKKVKYQKILMSGHEESPHTHRSSDSHISESTSISIKSHNTQSIDVYSQEEGDKVIDTTTEDDEYSQLFLEDQLINEEEQEEDSERIGNPNIEFVCNTMIKAGAFEDLYEEEDDGLFESHFSQCSQDISAESSIHQLQLDGRHHEFDYLSSEKDKQLTVVPNTDRGNQKEIITPSTSVKKDNKIMSVFKKKTDEKLQTTNNEIDCKSFDEGSKKSSDQLLCVTEKKCNSFIDSKVDATNRQSTAGFDVESMESEINKMKQAETLLGAKLVKSTLLSAPIPFPVKMKKKQGVNSEESVTKANIDKIKKEQIKQNRKIKLKDLAEKKKKEKSPTFDKLETINNIASDRVRSSEADDNVSLNDKNKEHSSSTTELLQTSSSVKAAKITERNRSVLMIEALMDTEASVPVPPVKRPRGRPRKSSLNDERPRRSSRSVGRPPKSSLPSRDGNGDQTLPKCPSKSCLKSIVSSSSTARPTVKSVTFSSKGPSVKMFICDGLILKSVADLIAKDRTPHMSVRPSPQPVKDITLIGETISDVLRWNTDWINERKSCGGEPLVYSEKFHVKDRFISYRDYTRWIYPLMLYELWANMTKSIDDQDLYKRGKVFFGVVQATESWRVHVLPDGKNLIILKCCIMMKRNEISSLLDPMDILLIKASSPSLPSEESRTLHLFGLIYSQVRMCSIRDAADPLLKKYLSNLNTSPDVCAYFDVIVADKVHKQLLEGFQLKIRPIYNMMSEIRQFESVIKLATSQYYPYIGDPYKYSTVCLPNATHEPKIVSKRPLNDDQQMAVISCWRNVLSTKSSISLVNGPPGTGKTTFILALVQQLLSGEFGKQRKILLCSHSNAAVDELCLRLLDLRKELPRDKRYKLTRFGRKEKIHVKVQEILTTTLARKDILKSLDEDLHLELSLAKAKERTFAAAIENSRDPERQSYIQKYKRVQAYIATLNALSNKNCSEESKKKHIDKLAMEAEMGIINSSEIIATTLGSCSSRRLTKALNDLKCNGQNTWEIGVCIVDEATQATESQILLPLALDVRNYVLVGDTQQLPPYVQSLTAKKYGFRQSLFTRLHNVWSSLAEAPLYKLRVQHRMHPQIAEYPSAAFYENNLITPPFLNVNRNFRPYAIFTHSEPEDFSGEINKNEADIVIKLLRGILNNGVYSGHSVGLIVPYQKQCAHVADLICKFKECTALTVNTIDSFQGQERDIIILSCVRTKGVGFLDDVHRTNVALTRAKKALYIVANFNSLKATTIWKDLLENADTRGVHMDLSTSPTITKMMNFLMGKTK